MKTTVEKLEDNKVRLTVTIEAKEVDDRIKKTYKDFARRYRFPGFRPGRAPRPVIDSMLGSTAAVASVTDDVLNETFPLALDAEDLNPIDQAQFVDEDQLVTEHEDFTYSATMTVAPEYELSSYDPVEIEVPFSYATESEIDEQVEAMKEYYYSMEDARANTKVKEETPVDLKIHGVDEDGNELSAFTSDSRLYELGMGLYPKSFDDELIGMKKGESKTIVIDLNEPCMMSQTMDDADKGKVTLDVTVNVVKKKVYPEITDEWCKETAGFEGGVEEFRNRIKESIEDQKKDLIPEIKETETEAKLADRLQGDVPEMLIASEETNLLRNMFNQLQARGMTLDAYLTQAGTSSEEFYEDVKRQATDVARQNLALDAWARHFDLKVTDQQVAEEFARSGEENPQEVQEQWTREGRLHILREAILRSNAVKDAVEKAKVTEVEKKTEEKPAKKKSSSKFSAKKSTADDNASEEKDAE